MSSDRDAEIAGSTEAALAAYAVATVGFALGALDSGAVADARRAVEGVAPGTVADSAELAWLGGVAAFASGDAAGVERARREIAGLPYPHGDLLASSLAGLARAARGDTAGAGRVLAELEDRKADRWDYAAYAPAHTWLSGVDRLFGARFLVASGEQNRAARLLTWHEAVRWARPTRKSG